MYPNCEMVEITSKGLFISVNAEKYENPVKSLVRNCGLPIVAEEIQHKFDSGSIFSPDREVTRKDFLYQAIIDGSNLEELYSRVMELMSNVRFLEKCWKKELVEKC